MGKYTIDELYDAYKTRAREILREAHEQNLNTQGLVIKSKKTFEDTFNVYKQEKKAQAGSSNLSSDMKLAKTFAREQIYGRKVGTVDRFAQALQNYAKNNNIDLGIKGLKDYQNLVTALSAEWTDALEYYGIDEKDFFKDVKDFYHKELAMGKTSEEAKLDIAHVFFGSL